ncbi:MAG: histidine phosphatase family protein [Candidatus Methylomirabilales bacterium]
MPELYIVRHGESLWNLEGRLQGGQDPPLSPRGRRQAQAVVRALSRARVRAVYASTLKRAAETAEILADGLGAPLTLDPDLREMGLGEWEGQPIALLQIRCRDTYQAWLDQPMQVSPPGAESMPLLVARTLRAFRTVREKTPDDAVAVVTHGVTARVYLASTLGLDLNQIYRLRLANGGISVVRFDQGSPRLVLLNDTCHLDEIRREDPAGVDLGEFGDQPPV